MSENQSTTSTSSKLPSHFVYQILDAGEGRKGFWSRIGSAWTHKDGNGFNIQITSVPLDGRITLRVATETKD